jgi:dihydrodipicolinate synthase/N-acetylneuraminate lyase
MAFYLCKEVLRLRGVFANTNVRRPATRPDEIAYRELRHEVEVLGLAPGGL